MMKRLVACLFLVFFGISSASASLCDSDVRNERASFRIAPVPLNFKAGTQGEAASVLFLTKPASYEARLGRHASALCIRFISDDTVIANVELDKDAQSFDLRTDDYGMLLVDEQPVGQVSIDSDFRVSGHVDVFFIFDIGDVNINPIIDKANKSRNSVQVTIFGLEENETRAVVHIGGGFFFQRIPRPAKLTIRLIGTAGSEEKLLKLVATRDRMNLMPLLAVSCRSIWPVRGYLNVRYR